MLSGALFTENYLTQGVEGQLGYAEAALLEPAFREWLRALFDGIGNLDGLSEAETEDRIVRPMLDRLGWMGLRSVQTAVTRHDIPDYTLYPDVEAYRAADLLRDSEKFRHAVAVADAKAWKIELDRRGSGAGINETPAGQVLRYMDRAAGRSATCRWGMLTNGRHWRLYWQGAADRLGSFFEVDLLAALGVEQDNVLPLYGIRVPPEHALTLFLLFFGQTGFGEVQRRALEEGKKWETGVRNDLAKTVFDDIYPGLIRALIEGDSERPRTLSSDYLLKAREAALTLLYRLLFVLYAEDRDLLPQRERRYEPYALNHLREDIGQRIDGSGVFSSRSDTLWRHAHGLFRLIDEGDDRLGVPGYNGKLFASSRSPLLERTKLPDNVFAPLLDALSRRVENGARKRINYRDLSVRELGSIYERLLEYEPVADPEAPAGVRIRLNPFARKGSGSYYTPDVLVRLIIERTVQPMVDERLEAFRRAVADAADERQDEENRRAWLDQADPATAILKLKVCDPAMGSGHFLVDLVDWLAAQVFTAIGGAEEEARELGLAWRSPLAAQLETLREQLGSEAERHGWSTKREQLNDANLIRRLVLKRCIYGVDKNPMAVELAKVALWLHTFTAGAPLSFLDHHLRCGDSLFGEWVDDVLRETEADVKGKRRSLLSGVGMFLRPAIQRAASAEKEMRLIEGLSDGVLSEVEQSADAYANVETGTALLKGFLDFRHALRWLKPDKDDEVALSALLGEQFGPPLEILAGKAEMIVPAELARTDGQIDLISVETAPEQMSLLPGAASGRDYVRARRIVDAARSLAAEQHFLHWQVAFPGVWRGWADARTGGFDAVIGNPPWDRMKMQEVEWFADRAPDIARQVRAADRKGEIDRLRADADPLVTQYDLARARAERAMEVARTAGAFPLLSRGDINLYSLFVERAQTLTIGRRGGVADPLWHRRRPYRRRFL
jgi:hypothetical protein